MTRYWRRFFLLLAIAPAFAASARDRDHGTPPPAEPVGAAVDCIPAHLIRESQVRSDRVIDFLMRDRRVFRTTLAQACPGLGYERRISYRPIGNRLCSTDILTVITSAPIQTGAACGLAPFQPITLTPTRRFPAR